jgi:hypothetical protein
MSRAIHDDDDDGNDGSDAESDAAEVLSTGGPAPVDERAVPRSTPPLGADGTLMTWAGQVLRQLLLPQGFCYHPVAQQCDES